MHSRCVHRIGRETAYMAPHANKRVDAADCVHAANRYIYCKHVCGVLKRCPKLGSCISVESFVAAVCLAPRLV